MEGFKEFFYHSTNGYTDQEVLHLYLSNDKKIREISQQTGKSIGEIYRTLSQYHVTPNRLRNNKDKVLEFLNFGFTVPQIAELTGYTSRNVRYIIAKHR